MSCFRGYCVAMSNWLVILVLKEKWKLEMKKFIQNGRDENDREQRERQKRKERKAVSLCSLQCF